MALIILQPLTTEEHAITIPSVDTTFFKTIYQTPNESITRKGVGQFEKYAIQAERFVNELFGYDMIRKGNGLGPKSIIPENDKMMIKLLISQFIDVWISDVWVLNENRSSREFSTGSIKFSEAVIQFNNPFDATYLKPRMTWNAAGFKDMFKNPYYSIIVAPNMYVLWQDFTSEKMIDTSDWALKYNTSASTSVQDSLNFIFEEVNNRLEKKTFVAIKFADEPDRKDLLESPTDFVINTAWFNNLEDKVAHPLPGKEENFNFPDLEHYSGSFITKLKGQDETKVYYIADAVFEPDINIGPDAPELVLTIVKFASTGSEGDFLTNKLTLDNNTTESISGNSTTQSDANQEFVEAIENLQGDANNFDTSKLKVSNPVIEGKGLPNITQADLNEKGTAYNKNQDNLINNNTNSILKIEKRITKLNDLGNFGEKVKGTLTLKTDLPETIPTKSYIDAEIEGINTELSSNYNTKAQDASLFTSREVPTAVLPTDAINKRTMEDLVSGIATGTDYKGAVVDFNSLPTIGQTNGDMYLVQNAIDIDDIVIVDIKNNTKVILHPAGFYIWSSFEGTWDIAPFDTSSYTKEEIDLILNNYYTKAQSDANYTPKVLLDPVFETDAISLGFFQKTVLGSIKDYVDSEDKILQEQVNELKKKEIDTTEQDPDLLPKDVKATYNLTIGIWQFDYNGRVFYTNSISVFPNLTGTTVIQVFFATLTVDPGLPNSIVFQFERSYLNGAFGPLFANATQEYVDSEIKNIKEIIESDRIVREQLYEAPRGSRYNTSGTLKKLLNTFDSVEFCWELVQNGHLYFETINVEEYLLQNENKYSPNFKNSFAFRIENVYPNATSLFLNSYNSNFINNYTSLNFTITFDGISSTGFITTAGPTLRSIVGIKNAEVIK